MVDVEKLNVSKYATRTGLAMAITDYLLYVEHNTRKALELCAEATKAVRSPTPPLIPSPLSSCPLPRLSSKTGAILRLVSSFSAQQL
jgi:hypothetical protein